MRTECLYFVRRQERLECENGHVTATDHYRTRFRKVLDYIDAHLDATLDVEKLSDVAAFSKFHFHRQFTATFGIGVSRYVQLKRLRRASYELAFLDDRSVMEIALASGYEGPEAFARAFRKSVGQSPAEFRRAPAWGPWHATYQPLSTLRSEHMRTDYHVSQVRIVDFPETRVATLEHRGDPALVMASVRNFIAWRRQNGLPPVKSATFNLLYDNPYEIEADRYRIDLCAATDREIAPNAHGVIAKTIPAGRCATLRHVGGDDTWEQAMRFLYSGWLPQSGEELRDFPPFVQRVKFFPEVPEHAAVIDVFLPLT
jgi:AraC family transcriptional regulator